MTLSSIPIILLNGVEKQRHIYVFTVELPSRLTCALCKVWTVDVSRIRTTTAVLYKRTGTVLSWLCTTQDKSSRKWYRRTIHSFKKVRYNGSPTERYIFSKFWHTSDGRMFCGQTSKYVCTNLRVPEETVVVWKTMCMNANFRVPWPARYCLGKHVRGCKLLQSHQNLLLGTKGAINNNYPISIIAGE